MPSRFRPHVSTCLHLAMVPMQVHFPKLYQLCGSAHCVHLPGASLRPMVCCIESYLMHAHLGNESRIHWELYGIPFSNLFFSPSSFIFSISKKVLFFSYLTRKPRCFFFLLCHKLPIPGCLWGQVAGGERESNSFSHYSFWATLFLIIEKDFSSSEL